MCGGVDEFVAKRNYDRTDTTFTIDTTFMIMGNNEIEIDTNDTWEQCIKFSSAVSYKTAAEIQEMRENGASELLIQSYRVKNPEMKSLCSSIDYANAFVYLLYESYKDSAVPIVFDSLKDDGDMSLRELILTRYKITGTDNDMIIAKDIEQELRKFTKGKIETELKSMNVLKKKIKNRTIFRDKTCYVGLKEKPTPTDETDNETDDDESL